MDNDADESDVILISDNMSSSFDKEIESKPASFKANYRNDSYCWMCHLDIDTVNCTICPRAFHLKCTGTSMQNVQLEQWTCTECRNIQRAEKERKILKKVTERQFQMMLESALKRLIYPDSVSFQTKVDQTQFPEYSNYVVYPMDLMKMDDKIKANEYASLEAFLADAKWIFHNCAVFNGLHSKLTAVAKSLLRMLKHEMNEIDVCPDCYLNSIIKFNDYWFCEPCRIPHPLIWAKMRSFPYWPAKALRIVNDEIDVRFFGAHDRAWINISKCFWLSTEMPKSKTSQRVTNLDTSLDELKIHINRLTDKFGEFVYAPFKQTIIPDKQFKFLPALKESTCLVVTKDTSRKAYSTCFENAVSEHLSNDTVFNDQSVNSSSIQTDSALKKRKIKKRKKRLFSKKDHANKSKTTKTTNEDEISIASFKSSNENLSISTTSDPVSYSRTQSNSSTTVTTLSKQSTSLNQRKNQSNFHDCLKTIKNKSEPLSGCMPKNSAQLIPKSLPAWSKVPGQLDVTFANRDSEMQIIRRNICTTRENVSQTDLSNTPENDIATMRQTFDKLVKEIKFNADLRIKEIMDECANEKLRMEKKFEALIDDVKKKQWCANCAKEAIYYCCWNASYCDEECQRVHWTSHINNCLRSKIMLDPSANID